MSARYVLALDQGTTSSRAILFDRAGNAVSFANQEFKQYYPQPAWVEHDADEIWQTQLATANQALNAAHAKPGDIAAIGVANQRETVVIWERETSRPIHHAIVWQCRRTAPDCDRIRQEGFDRVLRQRTGLVADAYFSATKIAWLLKHVPQARERAERGELCCGTIDSWLIWMLTGGKVHATDASNASRTLLFSLRTLDWDEEILRYFRIPRQLLPAIVPSGGVLGETRLLGDGGAIPIAGVAGDQQASLFGQRCLTSGAAKNTYGTGCFLLMNTGDRALESSTGLLSTVAWRRNGRTTYALEGSVFTAGAAIQWLRDELRIVGAAAETEAMARCVPDAGGVYFVPAFVGLGAPYWDAYARGAIIGLTRSSNRNHIARAALESIAYQTRDVLDCMVTDSGLKPAVLNVDGGAAANEFLCQFQADILGIPVERACITESTALGAALLAGLSTGFWDNEEDLRKQLEDCGGLRQRSGKRRFDPQLDPAHREELYEGWRRAVERAQDWAVKT
ncbi:MAG: glycerol kinase GlpK [Terriglobia bacterium]